MNNKPEVLSDIANEIAETKAKLDELYEERRQAIIFYRKRGATGYKISQLAGIATSQISRVTSGVLPDSSAAIPDILIPRVQKIEALLSKEPTGEQPITKPITKPVDPPVVPVTKPVIQPIKSNVRPVHFMTKINAERTVREEKEAQQAALNELLGEE